MNEIVESIKDMPMEMAAKEIKAIIEKPELDDINDQIKKLQAKKKAITTLHDELKDYLRENMQSAEISKIECSDFTISLIKPRDNVKVFDVDLLPDEYKIQEIIYTPFKEKIKADLKKGLSIEGAEMSQT